MFEFVALALLSFALAFLAMVTSRQLRTIGNSLFKSLRDTPAGTGHRAPRRGRTPWGWPQRGGQDDCIRQARSVRARRVSAHRYLPSTSRQDDSEEVAAALERLWNLKPERNRVVRTPWGW
ncbi:MAG: hypothetical protein R3348_03155 [Xanthomonadales bacterium]|nr:hypothetical protein [Xanthomonadales bacterium]